MPDDPERRYLVDPRYITWEVFDNHVREAAARFQRLENDAELRESRINGQLSEQAGEITRLRIASARQAVYISLVQAILTLGATAWISYLVTHH